MDQQRRPRGGTVDTRDLKSPEQFTEPATSERTCDNSPSLLAQPLAQESQKQAISNRAESKPLGADLALIVERWDALPEAVRAGIVAMVKAASVG